MVGRSALATTGPIGFAAATFDYRMGHETDMPRCPQFGRYQGESGHNADGPLRSRIADIGQPRDLRLTSHPAS
jgi:hypothetical protein